MLFTTTTQYVALAIALIAGWLFGLASHPGGRKWKQRYADERAAYATSRKDQDTELATAHARIKELESENTRLARVTPVAASTATPVAPRTAAPAAPRTLGEKRAWFDFGGRPGVTR